MTDIKRCIDCIHCLALRSVNERDTEYRCNHPMSVTSSPHRMITGNGALCLEERSNPNACGMEAKRFGEHVSTQVLGALPDVDQPSLGVMSAPPSLMDRVKSWLGN